MNPATIITQEAQKEKNMEMKEVHMVYTAVCVESFVYRKLNGLKLSVSVAAHGDPDLHARTRVCTHI